MGAILNVLLERTTNIVVDSERAPRSVSSLMVRRHDELPIRLASSTGPLRQRRGGCGRRWRSRGTSSRDLKRWSKDRMTRPRATSQPASTDSRSGLSRFAFRCRSARPADLHEPDFAPSAGGPIWRPGSTRGHPYSIPTTGRDSAVAQTDDRTCACSADRCARVARRHVSYTIFEGTSEIQRLVVARAISGLHIP